MLQASEPRWKLSSASQFPNSCWCCLSLYPQHWVCESTREARAQSAFKRRTWRALSLLQCNFWKHNESETMSLVTLLIMAVTHLTGCRVSMIFLLWRLLNLSSNKFPSCYNKKRNTKLQKQTSFIQVRNIKLQCFFRKASTQEIKSQKWVHSP